MAKSRSCNHRATADATQQAKPPAAALCNPTAQGRHSPTGPTCMRLVAFWSVSTDWLGTCQRWEPQVWLPLGKSWAWEAYPRIFKAKKRSIHLKNLWWFSSDPGISTWENFAVFSYNFVWSNQGLPCSADLQESAHERPTRKRGPGTSCAVTMFMWIWKNGGLIWAGCSCLASVVYASQSLCAFLNKLSRRFRIALLDVAALRAEPVKSSLHEPYLSSCYLLFLEVNTVFISCLTKLLQSNMAFLFLNCPSLRSNIKWVGIHKEI